ncbi:MAG TPA: hypothetical protein DCL48_08170 [Alphaproteobacteria bacterium]|nr:hypothetical protein [Alphaproteobacteria bacterium]
MLALDRLDLNPYLGGGGGGGGASGGWSDATIDLSGLNAADADLDLTLQGLSGAGLTLDRSRVGLAIAGGRLTLTVREANLYGGQGQGTVSTAAAGGIAANMRFNGVSVEPLLKDAVGYGSLTGSGNLTLNVKGQGRSQRAWMQSLGGNAALDIRDGALKGVDLAAVSRSVQGALAGGATGGSAKTDFAELTGSFVLRDGVAANDDLKMLNPFLRVTGKGLINIGQQTMDYRIEPKAVASIEGQGGKSDLGGVMVPFRITGPWSNLSYTPDLSGAIGGGFEDLLKGGGGAGKGGLDGLIPRLGGGDKDKAPEDKKDAPKKEKKPEDALKGLVPGL